MKTLKLVFRRRPTLHDYVSRIGLHFAKMRRRKYKGEHQKFYETFFSEKHVHQATYDLRHRLRRESVLVALREVLGSACRPVVLDVGCGVGDVIQSVPTSCYRVGTTYSEMDLQLARSTTESGVCFVRATAEYLPFSTGSIDGAICLEVLEHIADDRAAIRELARVLKPAGQLVISVPGHYYFAEYLELIGHHRHYSREQLVLLLEEVGLRVVQYINPQSRINTLHYYPYFALELCHQVLNRCGAQSESLYVRPLLGFLYGKVRDALQACKTDLSQKSLAASEYSTFVIAGKTDSLTLRSIADNVCSEAEVLS